MKVLASVATTAALLLTSPAHAAELTPVLRIAGSTAPVGVDIPYRITVTPAARAKGKRVRIQVKGIAAWRGFDSFRIPASGTITDDVRGYQPGVGRYRVLVVGKNGRLLAKSGVVSVAWTAAEQP